MLLVLISYSFWEDSVVVQGIKGPKCREKQAGRQEKVEVEDLLIKHKNKPRESCELQQAKTNSKTKTKRYPKKNKGIQKQGAQKLTRADTGRH